MGSGRPTAEPVLSAVIKASGLSLDTLLGWRFRADIARARAVAALILRREAGFTANEAGRILRRSRQSVHSLTDRATVSGGDPAAAELMTQALRLLWNRLKVRPG